jgi:putative nucleotidyltransferase with HDIG domain
MPLPQAELQKALTKFKDLPTLPDVVARVMQIVSNPLTTAEDLNQVISMDQALTFKVLRLANSAYYGFPKEITNITQSVTILGFNTIRNLALSVSVHKMLFADREKGLFSYREFWKHGVAVGVCARILARRVGYKSEENAFTAGLLHDIGKSLLDKVDHEGFMQAIEKSRESSRPLWDTERELFGLDHAALGGRLAEIWNLPQELRHAISMQHEPAEGLATVADPLVAAVHAANQLCRQRGLGDDGDYGPTAINGAVAHLLRLDEHSLVEINAELDARLKEAEEFLKFSKGA